MPLAWAPRASGSMSYWLSSKANKCWPILPGALHGLLPWGPFPPIRTTLIQEPGKHVEEGAWEGEAYLGCLSRSVGAEIFPGTSRNAVLLRGPDPRGPLGGWPPRLSAVLRAPSW